MVQVENIPLLSVPEEELQFEKTYSAGCFDCFRSYLSHANSGHEIQWWRQGLSKSMKRARELSVTVVDHAESGRKKLRNLVRRWNSNRNGRKMKVGRFQYDPSSYALNFDDGCRQQPESLEFLCHSVNLKSSDLSV